MKAYGIPRRIDIEYPDILDIKTFGMKSSTGQLMRKSGDFRSYTRSSKERRAIRIYWKRRERNRIKEYIRKQIEDSRI